MEDGEIAAKIAAHGMLVIPGQQLIAAPVRGPGTYVDGKGDVISAVCGVIEAVNNMVMVVPSGNARYVPSIGDLVVGRVVTVGAERWLLDIGAARLAELSLSSVQLPSGEQRRRTVEDQLQMRQRFAEDDVVVAEVQAVSMEGVAYLYCRNANYGILKNGVLVRVPNSLVQRMSNHMVELTSGPSLILGRNGFCWVGAATPKHSNVFESAGFVETPDLVVDLDVRHAIARTRNLLIALVAHRHPIDVEVLEFLFQQTVEKGIAAKAILDKNSIEDVICFFSKKF